jgi:hypothetical protein
MQTTTFRGLVLERLADLSLAEAADRLGISVQYMSNLRTGYRGGPLSPRLAGRALQLWPDLTDAYLSELRGRESDGADAAHEEARASR